MSCNNSVNDFLPRTLHWRIRPGSTAIDFTFRILEGGTAIDITDYDFTLEVRRPNGTLLLELTSGDGITFVSSTQGRATVGTTESAGLPQDIDLQWSFGAITPTDETLDLLAGIIEVTARTSACVRVPDSTDFTFTATPSTFDFEVVRTAEGPYSVALAVTDGDTYNMPAGRMLMSIAVDPDDDDRTLSVGHSDGSTEVLDHEEIPAESSYSTTLNRYYYTAQTFHFSGDAATIKLYIF